MNADNPKIKPISFISFPCPDGDPSIRVIGAKYKIDDLDRSGVTFGLWTDFIKIPLKAHDVLAGTCLELRDELCKPLADRRGIMWFLERLDKALEAAKGNIPPTVANRLEPGQIIIHWPDGETTEDEIDGKESYGHTANGFQYISKITGSKILISPFHCETIEYLEPIKE